MRDEPDLTLGIEEEYLLVDPESGDLVHAPDGFMSECQARMGDSFSPEFLRCQVEIGTPVAANIREARQMLADLRGNVAEIAGKYGLAPIAASCHPYADWREQVHTDKDRYNQLSRDMGGVARRMLISGMHVHVGIANKALRIDLMNQFSYFLPWLLALSASSPFWQGQDTGLASYRTTVFGDMPRTGLPPQMGGWGEFERSVETLTRLGIIEDSSKIWWDLRPSARFPTLETRICDGCPRLEDTITLAALIQTTIRMLWRLSLKNARWRHYDNFLLGENRWRALRYGTTKGQIDFGADKIVPFPELAEGWLELIAEDADALDCQPAVARLRDMTKAGTAAERQRGVFAGTVAAGASTEEALRAVVAHLVREFRDDL